MQIVATKANIVSDSSVGQPAQRTHPKPSDTSCLSPDSSNTSTPSDASDSFGITPTLSNSSSSIPSDASEIFGIPHPPPGLTPLLPSTPKLPQGSFSFSPPPALQDQSSFSFSSSDGYWSPPMGLGMSPFEGRPSLSAFYIPPSSSSLEVSEGASEFDGQGVSEFDIQVPSAPLLHQGTWSPSQPFSPPSFSSAQDDSANDNPSLFLSFSSANEASFSSTLQSPPTQDQPSLFLSFSSESASDAFSPRLASGTFSPESESSFETWHIPNTPSPCTYTGLGLGLGLGLGMNDFTGAGLLIGGTNDALLGGTNNPSIGLGLGFPTGARTSNPTTRSNSGNAPPVPRLGLGFMGVYKDDNVLGGIPFDGFGLLSRFHDRSSGSSSSSGSSYTANSYPHTVNSSASSSYSANADSTGSSSSSYPTNSSSTSYAMDGSSCGEEGEEEGEPSKEFLEELFKTFAASSYPFASTSTASHPSTSHPSFPTSPSPHAPEQMSPTPVRHSLGEEEEDVFGTFAALGLEKKGKGKRREGRVKMGCGVGK
ncbi:hypothetical protein JAAARDRAFT_198691 [Jaapia argillacea MUCL 33604]|uniref:Uncharacterized protein n=1 Tax=Jaapia argillacea MUCL 33604 TaxID=933084 RepID=A0A067PNY1_9AGAM|nr:hypothetical protein JAAARDRAFT_198691 [Jaapia argillacea MUCL 33604]